MVIVHGDTRPVSLGFQQALYLRQLMHNVAHRPLSFSRETLGTRRTSEYGLHMVFSLERLADLSSLPFDEIIDVRSPAEFAEDHLPGAVNLPVLSDAERAHVGTIYKQESPFRARKVGAALVARNAAGHIEGHFRDKPERYRPLIYCWRGGMRSNALSTILRGVGWRAEILEGGYKQYRRLVLDLLYGDRAEADNPWPWPVILIDGNTGTAKTELLKTLERAGGQTFDLEAFANHRGSVFGGFSDPQPTQKSFDTRIAMGFASCSQNRPVFLEAESSKIGNLAIPKRLWLAMRSASRIRIEASMDARARYLCEAYGDLTQDPDRLKETIQRLRPFHAREQIDHWLRLAADGHLVELASSLMTQHYDPAYHRHRRRTTVSELCVMRLASLSLADLEHAADQILDMEKDQF